MSEILIRAADLSKGFQQPDGSRLPVLTQLNLEVKSGEILAITGASGSGKSTLLHILGALDRGDSGDIFFKERNVAKFSASQINSYRNSSVGFVYQFHHLMPELCVWENVAFPYLLQNFDQAMGRARAVECLTQVGLEEKSLNLPSELSGGERQRVAIARSLINSPELVLTDEPTGNLDLKTGQKVFELLKQVVHENGASAVVVTHNLELAEQADRHLQMREGKLVSGRE